MFVDLILLNNYSWMYIFVQILIRYRNSVLHLILIWKGDNIVANLQQIRGATSICISIIHYPMDSGSFLVHKFLISNYSYGLYCFLRFSHLSVKRTPYPKNRSASGRQLHWSVMEFNILLPLLDWLSVSWFSFWCYLHLDLSVIESHVDCALLVS